MATIASLHIGKKLRRRRVGLGLSQGDIGAGLGGITQQAVSKMERGGEISGTQLLVLSQILKVPVSYFFDGIDGSSTEKKPMKQTQGRSEKRERSWPPGLDFSAKVARA